MIRLLFLLTLVTGDITVLAQQEKSRFEQFLCKSTLCVTPVEAGDFYRIQTNKENFGGEIVKAYSGLKNNGVHFGYFGLGYCYDQRLEIGVLPFSAESSSNGTEFRSYMAIAFPNYYTDKITARRTTVLKGLGFYASYRKVYPQLQLEARFQFLPNVYKPQEASFYLKEKGSNQYIEYTIREEVSNSRHVYQLSLGICRPLTQLNRLFKLEIGVNTGVFLAPIQSQFYFIEQPYNQPTQVQQVNDFSWNPSFFWSVRFRFIIGAVQNERARQ